MQADITLREIGPDDGPHIAALSDQTPDTGAVAFQNVYYYDPYATMMALHHDATGVVVEAADHEGIVGIGMMSIGECQYDGELRPYAYLFGLNVHPDYRRRGIATQIAAWRAEKARALLGADVVIFAAIQQGNDASFRSAAKWSSQRLDGRSAAGVVKMRASPPKSVTGLTVRPAEINDFEEIAEKQNHYYRELNLYPPRSPEALSDWHRMTPFGVPLRTYFVVADNDGNLVGGLSATAEGQLTAGHIVRMPWSLRLANVLLRVLPANGVSKRIHVKDLWYAPEQMDAGKYLWESVRWLQRQAGTMMMCYYDAQGRLGQIIEPPTYMPVQNGSVVVAGLAPMSEERLIYFHI